jgi:hypothetical protein
MLSYLAGPSPSPSPGAPPTDRTGLVVLAALVAFGFLATVWLRRAAARYRKRLHDGEAGVGGGGDGKG